MHALGVEGTLGALGVRISNPTGVEFGKVALHTVTGLKRPCGASLKLLTLVAKNGLGAVA